MPGHGSRGHASKDLLARRQAAFDQRMNQLQVQAQNDVKSRAAELAIGALRKSLPEQLSAKSLSPPSATSAGTAARQGTPGVCPIPYPG